VRVWVDAQLPPALARSVSQSFGVEALHVSELRLVSGKDEAIFLAARAAGAIVTTKDSDFVRLLERHGPPPKILWITLGNLRNVELTESLEKRWERVMAHFEAGESLVELGGNPDGR
jgi:predicted nuclease of predicted toxin-antitoxin system